MRNWTKNQYQDCFINLDIVRNNYRCHNRKFHRKHWRSYNRCVMGIAWNTKTYVINTVLAYCSLVAVNWICSWIETSDGLVKTQQPWIERRMTKRAHICIQWWLWMGMDWVLAMCKRMARVGPTLWLSSWWRRSKRLLSPIFGVLSLIISVFSWLVIKGSKCN